MLTRLFLLAALFAVTGCGRKTAEPHKAQTAETPTLALFAPPRGFELSAEGKALIYEYEVGGGRGYYDRHLARPSWPGFASGVTIGIGYDVGQTKRALVMSDWQELPEKQLLRVAATAGITGKAAEPKARELRDILIAWGLAEQVFTEVTVARFWQLTKRTFPGIEELRPNAQAALLSLVFNRGSSMAGPRRVQMRAIRDLVPNRDYRGIAARIRAMKKIWKGTDIEAGMVRRREAEAALLEHAARK